MTVDDIHPRALHGPGRLASLHVLAIRVPCPRPPRGCGVAAGERCLNLLAQRDAGAAPREMRAPHPARLRAAEGPVPAPRGPGVPPEPVDDDHDDVSPF